MNLKIGNHHFAFLRAIALGLPPIDSAKRYLGVDHGHEAITVSRNTIQAVRAIAKRNSEKSVWRLIGLTIKLKENTNIPLEEFIEANNLDDWSESDVLSMYKEAYPKSIDSINVHREKLRLKQVELLDSLQELSVQTPNDTDMVSGWFEEITAKKLIGSGIITIGNLKVVISKGGRWYSALPAIGKSKSEKIKSFLESICGPITVNSGFSSISVRAKYIKRDVFDHIPGNSSENNQINSNVSRETYNNSTRLSDNPLKIDKNCLINKQLPAVLVREKVIHESLISATNDSEAIQSWIAARAGSDKTVSVYSREGIRLLLWLNRERNDISLNQMRVEDCLGYMTFLQNIPDSWMSKRNAKPFEAGWAPFRGKLSHDSQKQSIVIVASLFSFLQAASYIRVNPWVLVNQKTGDDTNRIVKTSRAISEFGFSEIIRYIESQEVTINSERIRFIFKFLEAVGLRSMEFLNARLEHFQDEEEGLILYVSGKGSKNRYVFIPKQAQDALERYLTYRGLSLDSDAQGWLVGSTIDPLESIGYQAFYQHVRSWTIRAIRESTMTDKEKRRLEDASPHWLRHTFGTRAVSRNVPMDAIQAQMGHASIKTTMDIYGRAPLARRAHELGKAFK